MTVTEVIAPLRSLYRIWAVDDAEDIVEFAASWIPLVVRFSGFSGSGALQLESLQVSYEFDPSCTLYSYHAVRGPATGAGL